MTEQEKAEDIIYWVKDDIKCLYLAAEVKEQVKEQVKNTNINDMFVN